MLRKHLSLLAVVAAILWGCSTAAAQKYAYDSVPGDPLHTRAYTLPNGLKIFMTVNRDEPRIQTYIAVRVGGKNDPAETTGLAHYFEHLMFKGTEQFGTTDYASEKPMLDRIEQLLRGQKTVLNFAEACEFTGLSRTYMYKLTHQGRIPHFKPHGKHIYFNREELERWLLQNPVKTAEQKEREAVDYVVRKRRPR